MGRKEKHREVNEKELTLKITSSDMTHGVLTMPKRGQQVTARIILEDAHMLLFRTM